MFHFSRGNLPPAFPNLTPCMQSTASSLSHYEKLSIHNKGGVHQLGKSFSHIKCGKYRHFLISNPYTCFIYNSAEHIQRGFLFLGKGISLASLRSSVVVVRASWGEVRYKHIRCYVGSSIGRVKHIATL